VLQVFGERIARTLVEDHPELHKKSALAGSQRPPGRASRVVEPNGFARTLPMVAATFKPAATVEPVEASGNVCDRRQGPSRKRCHRDRRVLACQRLNQAPLDRRHSGTGERVIPRFAGCLDDAP
jgi:hypothetical protein